VEPQRRPLPKILVLISHVELITPPSRLADEVQKVLPAYAGAADIRVVDVPFTDALAYAKKETQRREGFDVLVCAGATGAYLRANLDAPVVLMPITGYDVIFALEQARRVAKPVGVLSYRRPVAELQIATQLLTVRCRQETYTTLAQAEQKVDLLSAEGFEVIVGSSMVTEVAARRGLTGILINSPISIKRALDDAIAIAGNARASEARKARFSTILEYLGDGVLVTDAQRRIVAVNAAFARLCDIHTDASPGQPIGDIGAWFGIEDVLQSGMPKTSHVITLGNRTLVYSVTPIPDEEGHAGAMLVVQDASIVQRADRQIRAEARRRTFTASYRLTEIAAESAVMLAAIDLARRYAQSDTTVLITGESGTGKELFAQGIHNESARANRPFVAINCAGFPETLLESELFGYEEGAFTGSRRGGKPGLFELAHTGTVFLDEIGEMPLSLQTRLLRVLQQREVVRLGGVQPTPIDVRVIAATHRNLQARVASDAFRQDLYYRLNILRLKLPPLRERGGDIALLAERLLSRIAAERPLAADAARIVASLLPYLTRHTWPGNVRELENVMERAAVLLGGPDADDATVLARAIFDDEEVLAASASHGKAAVLDLVESRERVRMLQVIGQCDGNLSMAAKQLGISRSTLWRRMKDSGR
jgi:transcriptional regulator, propionate catabolism operon regulatory protein